MTSGGPARSRVLVAASLLVAALLCAPAARAQDMVRVAVPPAVSFAVADVTRNTEGSPTSTTVSFSNASLLGKALRISVEADTESFSGPMANGAIPAASVSWRLVGASGGIGWNGTLSATAYGLVFQGDPQVASGHADLAWTLKAPGAGIRAGVHQLTIRWKIEAIVP